MDSSVSPTLVPTPASAWKGKIDVEGTDLLLPSNNVARIRPLSPTAFLASGMIPDPLSALIRTSINSKKGLPPQALNQIAEDPAKLAATMELFDRVLCHVAVEPVIEMPPPCDVDGCGEYATSDVHKNGKHRYHEGPRDPAVLYADTIDMSDKMFIFNWCLGGTRDLERFREELEGSVEPVSHGTKVSRSSKRPAGRS